MMRHGFMMRGRNFALSGHVLEDGLGDYNGMTMVMNMATTKIPWKSSRTPVGSLGRMGDRKS